MPSAADTRTPVTPGPVPGPGDPVRAEGDPDPAGGPADRPVGQPAAVSAWQVALSPRMVGLLILFLAAAAVCGRLGMWQLDRAEIRGAAAEQERLAEVEAQAPAPIAEVLAPQSTFDGTLVGRRVLATGTYQADGQLLVADRVHDGRTGWLVLTPLRVTEGEGAGAVLPVVRGWVEDADAARSAGLLDVPAGTVQVTGYLQAGEDSRQVDGALPEGTTDSISSAELLTAWGGPIWTGYAVLSAAVPAQSDGITLLDPPTRAGTGLNIQNLAYAAEWWIFGGFAVLLWVRMLKDEVRRRRGEDPPGLGERRAGPARPDRLSPAARTPTAARSPRRRRPGRRAGRSR